MAEQPSFRDFQTMAAYIATHPRLQEIVEELEADLKADKTLFNEANKAPKKHLNDRGFDLPDEWTVQITHDSPVSITVCVNSYCVTLSVEVTVVE